MPLRMWLRWHLIQLYRSKIENSVLDIAFMQWLLGETMFRQRRDKALDHSLQNAHAALMFDFYTQS